MVLHAFKKRHVVIIHPSSKLETYNDLWRSFAPYDLAVFARYQKMVVRAMVMINNMYRS